MLISSRFIKVVSPLAVAIALASCGGGGTSFGDGGSSSSGGSSSGGDGGKLTTQVVTSVDLQADSLGVQAGGADSVNLTAIAKNASNSSINDADITFSVDNNGTLVTSGSSAVLTSNGAAVGTVFTVTATSGEVSQSVQVIVTEQGDDHAVDLEFSTSARTLPSDGSSPITISAIAKDVNNNAISGADITFSVDNGATITPASGTDGSVVTANLTPGTPENRTLNVTASSGIISKTVTIEVVGTTVTIDGPSSIVLNKDVPYVLKLKDSSNQPIAFEAVVLTSTAGNTINITSAANDQTNQNGEIAFTLNGQGGTDTLRATVLGVVYEKTVTISADQFELSSGGASDEININTPQTIDVLWTVSGVAQANKTITISATRGSIPDTTVETDSSGRASFTISSSTAGQTVISATTATGLSTSLNKEFVATTPAYLNTQADPSLISPNGSSSIIAKIRDADDNPVKNKTIDFQLNDTVNGVLSASTAVTDSLGRASVSYTAGNSSSEKDGVVIKTFIQGYPIVADDEVSLTVGGNALRIVLGHDQLVGTDEIFYVKKYGVIVTDSAGSPIKNKSISFKVSPTHYYKGFMRTVDTDGDGEADIWSQYLTASECLSEDFDGNGKLDDGEDINDNGTLEPTQDATITGNGVTDDQGKIVVELVYPKSRALWSKQTISATTLVEGTEFVEYTDLVLPIAAADVTNVEVGVPNAISPYGISNSCLNDDDTYDAPISAQVVNAVTNVPVTQLVHDVWYTARFIDALGNQVTGEAFTVESTVVDIQNGPGNTFKLNDSNTAVDNSGFFVTLTVGNNAIPLFYKDDAPVVVTDTTAPVLTLNGSSSITIEEGENFTDPGANATDAVDGNVNVVVTGNVDPDTLGTYTLIYTATDNAGNEASQEREVNVVAVGSGSTDIVLGAVEFVGAAPQTILLQGMSAPGLEHTSTVTFLIKDDVGNPIKNEDVDFELTSSVGGTRLTSATVKTDSQGFANATLQAGTVHTSVRVRASVTLGDKTLSSESSQIIISTGIADQNSLSLSLSTLNPSAWNHDGETVSVNMYASDRYNNPVPDGTTVAFYTELGQIEPSCNTTNGACSVTWTSSDPRTLGITPPGGVTYNDDGRSTITAAVIGEESFVDTNSNGIFDDGDLFDTNSDRGEAFEDYNRNGSYDVGLEPYLDYNGDGTRNPKDNKYTGLACQHSTDCETTGNGLKDIFTSTDLILAESFQNVVFKDFGGNVVNTIVNGQNYLVEVSGTRNSQIPPAGTSINASSDEADIVLGTAEVGSSNATGVYTMTLLVKDKDVEVQENGLIKITVSTPLGAPQEVIINYQDDPAIVLP